LISESWRSSTSSGQVLSLPSSGEMEEQPIGRDRITCWRAGVDVVFSPRRSLKSKDSPNLKGTARFGNGQRRGLKESTERPLMRSDLRKYISCDGSRHETCERFHPECPWWTQIHSFPRDSGMKKRSR
jgi:hypothetical protein